MTWNANVLFQWRQELQTFLDNEKRSFSESNLYQFNKCYCTNHPIIMLEVGGYWVRDGYIGVRGYIGIGGRMSLRNIRRVKDMFRNLPRRITGQGLFTKFKNNLPAHYNILISCSRTWRRDSSQLNRKIRILWARER